MCSIKKVKNTAKSNNAYFEHNKSPNKAKLQKKINAYLSLGINMNLKKGANVSAGTCTYFGINVANLNKPFSESVLEHKSTYKPSILCCMRRPRDKWY